MLAGLIILAHIYSKKKEQEMKWEKKATVHAKLMVKDVHRHTPAKAEMNSTETELIFKWTGSTQNSPLKRHFVGGNLLDSCWGTLVEYGSVLNLAWRQTSREVAIHEGEEGGSFDFPLKDIFYKSKQSNNQSFPILVIFSTQNAI